ncbi:IS701 family transposase [Frigoriglobus tundricola]|uniref:Mobile element protein n=1 Tax=Frigoriglobus tundricola TaxID=2774151 RepID=A0A6M5YXU4_9BACT|nr:transposase [Frigoriglobus tundricola]QJW98937.1 Mobile element protein [Frigoriglobus tundricola]
MDLPDPNTIATEPILHPREPLSEARLARFEEYVAAFRPAFHRADQLLRFRAYVRGLLEPTERKNVEAIAAAASRVMMVESNLAQALQHFVSHSPWDAGRLFVAIRQHNAAVRRDPDAVWVVHDGVFAKKGRHSVGVQRQFARSVGRKINCQVGVFVSQVGPAGYFPLAARLYLPASWLRENADAAEKGLPADDRHPATKVELALRLLDELRGEGNAPLPITGEPGYIAATDFNDGLATRGLAAREDRSEQLAEALRRFDWLKNELGLDHFEGRAWHGWHHHVGLVFAAYGFLSSEKASPDRPPFRSSAASPL